MFITKKHISRRTMLRGMGAAVALPFMESMVPAQTPLKNTAANPRSRFAAIEIVHGNGGSTMYGTENNLWAPGTQGRDFEFGKIIKPLEPFQEYTTIVSDTDCSPADAITAEEVGADHFRSSAVFLTAAHAKQTEGSDIYNGTSIDQMYAHEFGQDTPLPSIQLSIENLDSSGTCGYHYSCFYMGHHQLVLADDSAADDSRPAAGVRGVVRFGWNRRRPGHAATDQPQHSGRHHPRCREAEQGSRPRGSRQAQRLSGQHPGVGAPDPEDRGV